SRHERAAPRSSPGCAWRGTGAVTRATVAQRDRKRGRLAAMALAGADGTGGSMRWASVVSERADAGGAAEEASAALLDALAGPPDLACLFCSDASAAEYARLAEGAVARLGGGLLVGCSGRSVIGAGREIEGRPAVSLLGARLPKVSLKPVRLAGDGF